MTRTFSAVITAAALAPLLSVSAGAVHYGDGSAALLLGQTFSSVVCVLLLAFVLSWFARFIAIRQPLPQRFRGLQLIVSCLLFFPLAFTLVEGSVALAIPGRGSCRSDLHAGAEGPGPPPAAQVQAARELSAEPAAHPGRE